MSLRSQDTVHGLVQLSLVVLLICVYQTDAINWAYTYDGDDQRKFGH